MIMQKAILITVISIQNRSPHTEKYQRLIRHWIFFIYGIIVLTGCRAFPARSPTIQTAP